MTVTNPYYEFNPTFTPGTKARSDAVNLQYQALQNAFDLLPGDADAITTGTSTFAPESGSGNAYVVTMPDTRTTEADGDEVIFFATHTNTLAATLDVDGLGAHAIVRADGVALTADDIVSGILYVVRYDVSNTRYQLIGPSTSYLTDAAASVSAAAASAVASDASATASAGSASLAQEWATNVIDDDITGFPGQYSALHWADGASQAWAIQAEDSTIQTSFGGDGATTYSAFHWAQKALGAATIQSIIADIPTATPPTTEGVTALLKYEDADQTDDLAEIGFFGGAAAILQVINRMHGGVVRISGENNAGVLTTIFNADPDSSSTFYRAGVAKLNTQLEGINIFGSVATASPPTTELVNTHIGLWDLTGDDEIGIVGFTGNTTLSMRNQMRGGPVLLTGKTTAGADKNLMSGDPDGASWFYYDDAAKIGSAATGVRLLADINTATPPTTEAVSAILSYYDLQNFDALGDIGFIGSQILRIRNYMHGGAVIIDGQDVAGVTQLLLQGDPDADVKLYHAGTEAARTLAVASGGFEVDNQLTAAGFERVLTVSDKPAAGSLLPAGTVNNAMLVWDITGSEWQEEVTATADSTGLRHLSGSFHVEINHDGSQGILSTNNGDLVMLPASDITRIQPGDNFRILGGAGNDYVNFQHDGTDFNVAAIQTEDLNFTGLAGQLRSDHPLSILEASAALSDTPAYGQFWVKDDDPNVPMFTDDTGVDYALNASGGGSILSDQWTFSTNISSNPGDGQLRFNSGTLGNISNMWVDDLADSGNDFGVIVAALTEGDRIIIASEADASVFLEFVLRGTPTDTGGSSYWSVPVDYVRGTGALPADASTIRVEFSPTVITPGATTGIIRDIPVWDDDKWIPSGTNFRVNVSGPPVGGRITGGGSSSVVRTNPACFNVTVGASSSSIMWFQRNGTHIGHWEDVVMGSSPYEHRWGWKNTTDFPLFELNSWQNVAVLADATFMIVEKSAAFTDRAGRGQIWVKDDEPNTLWFTDDAGGLSQLSGIGGQVITWSSGAGGTYQSGSFGVFESGSSQSFESGSILEIQEAASMVDPAAGYGRIWVRSDAPNTLMFTDDAGDDYPISSAGGAFSSGNPNFAREYDSTTAAADPGTGKFRTNNAVPGSATALYVNDDDAFLVDYSSWIGGLSPNDIIVMGDTNVATEDWEVFVVTDNPTDNTGWWTIPIRSVTGNGTSFTATNIFNFTIQYTQHAQGIVYKNADLDSGTVILGQENVGQQITYNTGTARTLSFNNDGTILAGSMWAYIVGPSAGVLTGDGGTGVVIDWWNGSSWTTTTAAGNITIGEGSGTIWKDTSTHYYIMGPNLS